MEKTVKTGVEKTVKTGMEKTVKTGVVEKTVKTGVAEENVWHRYFDPEGADYHSETFDVCLFVCFFVFFLEGEGGNPAFFFLPLFHSLESS
jgi:hypothetical protein